MSMGTEKMDSFTGKSNYEALGNQTMKHTEAD